MGRRRRALVAPPCPSRAMTTVWTSRQLYKHARAQTRDSPRGSLPLALCPLPLALALCHLPLATCSLLLVPCFLLSVCHVALTSPNARAPCCEKVFGHCKCGFPRIDHKLGARSRWARGGRPAGPRGLTGQQETEQQPPPQQHGCGVAASPFLRQQSQGSEAAGRAPSHLPPTSPTVPSPAPWPPAPAPQSGSQPGEQPLSQRPLSQRLSVLRQQGDPSMSRFESEEPARAASGAAEARASEPGGAESSDPTVQAMSWLKGAIEESAALSAIPSTVPSTLPSAGPSAAPSIGASPSALSSPLLQAAESRARAGSCAGSSSGGGGAAAEVMGARAGDPYPTLTPSYPPHIALEPAVAPALAAGPSAASVSEDDDADYNPDLPPKPPSPKGANGPDADGPDANGLLAFTFGVGPMGIELKSRDGAVIVTAVAAGSAAAARGVLLHMELVRISKSTVQGLDTRGVLQVLKATKRPLTLFMRSPTAAGDEARTKVNSPASTRPTRPIDPTPPRRNRTP